MNPLSLAQLPTEILEHIFVLAGVANLRLVSTAFHGISRSPVIRARLLEQSCRGKVSRILRSKLVSKEVVRALIQRGTINLSPHGDQFFVRWCCAYNRADLLEVAVKSMVARGSTLDIHADNEYGLRIAAQNGHLELVEMLVELGADVHVDDDHALRAATQYRHTEVARYLLEHAHANVHADGNYALRTCASDDNLPLMETFLERGADPRAQDDEALVLASVNGHATIVQRLLDEGCASDARENMAMRGATEKKQWPVVRVLLNNDARPSADLALRLVDDGQWEMCGALLSACSDDVDVNMNGGILLTKACLAGEQVVVEKLLRHGANPALKPNLLTTLATSTIGRSEVAIAIAQMLISYGANMSREEVTCMRLARHPFLAVLSRHNMSRPNSTSSADRVRKSGLVR